MRTNSIIRFAILFLMVPVLSCRNAMPKDKPEATLTLLLRAGAYANAVKAGLSDFQTETNTFVVVKELGEEELHRKVAESAGGADAFDLCMVDSSWMAEFTSKNVLAELDSLGFSLDDDIIPATKNICYKDGHLFVAPYYGNVTVLLFNKIIVKEAGFRPDDITSIEDIEKICKFSKKRHNLGFMYRGDTANNIVVDFLPILRSFGGWVVDEDNNPTIYTKEFVAALRCYIELTKTGRSAKKDDLTAAIANKAAAMGIGWPGWYTPTRNSTMDYIALTGKRQKNSAANNANIYGIWTLGISQFSTQKERAAKLLSHLMDRNVQMASLGAGGVPCRYSSLRNEEYLRKYPQYAAVCDALENGVYRPVMERWNEFYAILGKHMKEIIEGDMPIRDGLLAAQRELNEAFGTSASPK